MEEETRESIWSVPRRAKEFYFALFSVQTSLGLLLIGWREWRYHGDSWPDVVLAIWERASSVVITSAAVAVIITEIVRFGMVLADWLARKLEKNREAEIARIRAEGYEEGFAEGKRRAEEGNRNGNGASEESNPSGEDSPTAF